MNRCAISPDCTFGLHDATEHPCGIRHIPGSACDHCGKATPLDGTPCPDCWTSLDGIPLADLKAMFAGIGLSLTKDAP